MSLFPARNAAEAKWQYCNYGYDHSKFSSFDDCMKRHDEVFKSKNSPPPPQNNKTFGEMPPQKESVGEKDPSGAPSTKQDPTNPESQFEYLLGIRMTKPQKWAVVIGVTLGIYGFAYYMYKKN
jgi:hypothetical protein